MRITNEQKRILEEVHQKLGKALEREGFTASYHPQLGPGITLHSQKHSITKVLNGPMRCVEGVELFLESYFRGRRDATMQVTAEHQAKLREMMGVQVNEDGTLYVHVN